MQIETLILRNLMLNEDYTRTVIPHLKLIYFEDPYRAVFSEIVDFVNKFNKLPSADALSIELRNNPKVGSDSLALIPEISVQEKEQTMPWLIEHTEKWCQDRAIYLAIMDSINIIEGKHETLGKNSLPEVLSEALGVNFDIKVGHDYVDDSDSRFDFYHREEEHLPFDLEMFNKITKGGLVNKSLNVALAGTGVGKSLFMCHVAAGALTQMKNVLYITMEMAEERIAERIDANLMNVPIDQLENLSKDMFDKKMHKLTDKGVGKLIVKEYPTGAANANNFRSLLKELKIKRDFEPDLICIDYLNICSSARMKAMGGSINSYTYVKAIAEELRGLAVEFNLPVLTATQTTRGGFGNSDVGLEDTSESFGLPATADLMFALIATEELDNMNQIMIKQLKNRYNDPTGSNKKFVVGIDRAKMRLYDVEKTAQTLNVRDEPPKVANRYEEFNV
jgi:archaellum biogenesis ATPase FlaH|tara:strand:- start:1202 stop:2548 length:1347 start_codon:yes stop_codon:yes gene_type:complete